MCSPLKPPQEPSPEALGRRCKALNKRGEPCEATVVGADGYCVPHSPARKVDMRELGRKGGKGRRSSVARLDEGERESLRARLRSIDPDTVRAAVTEALAGDQATAKMSAVKLLSDLDVYSKQECPVCAERKMQTDESRDLVAAKLRRLCLSACVSVLCDSPSKSMFAVELQRELEKKGLLDKPGEMLTLDASGAIDESLS